MMGGGAGGIKRDVDLRALGSVTKNAVCKFRPSTATKIWWVRVQAVRGVPCTANCATAPQKRRRGVF